MYTGEAGSGAPWYRQRITTSVPQGRSSSANAALARALSTGRIGTGSLVAAVTAVTDALGFVPGSCCVHYDSDPGRRPLYHQLVRDQRLAPGFALDEGAGIVYHGDQAVDVVTDIAGHQAYRVERSATGQVEETPLPARLLT